MTNRYFALTVVLNGEIRDDDAQTIIDAIKMIRGVKSVDPLVASPELHAAKKEANAQVKYLLQRVIDSLD